MPGVTEQFVTEFLVQGWGQFKSALGGADKLMMGLDKTGSLLSRTVSTTLGTALGNTLVNAANSAVNAVRGAGRAMGDFVDEGVGMAIDFDSSMADLEIAASATGLSFDTLRDAAIMVGGDTDLLGVSATGASESLIELYKSGLSTNLVFGDLQGYLAGTAELGGALRASIDMAAATELDMAAASGLATVALSSFGSELDTDADKAQFMNDALNNMVMAADASKTDVTGMAAAWQMASTSFSSANRPIEEMNTALAVLSMQGMEGSFAGTAVANALDSLKAPTDAGAEALADLGIEVRDTVTGQMKPMVNIVEEFEDAFVDLGAAERDAALATIFTKQGQRGMGKLLQAGADGWRDMEEAISEAATTQEQAARKADTLAGRMEAFEGTVETIKIQIGTALMPVLTDLLGWVASMVETHGPTLIAIFESIGEGLSGVLKYLLAVSEDGDLLNDWLTHVPEFAQPVLEIIGGLILLFQDMQAGVFGIDYPWEDIFPEWLADIMYAIVEAVIWLQENVLPLIETVRAWVVDNIALQDVLVVLAGVILGVVVPAVVSFLAPIAAVVAAIGLAIAVVASLRKLWEEDFLGIASALTAFWDGTARPVLEQVWTWLQENVPAALATLKDFWVNTAWPAIQSALENAWATIENIWTTLSEWVTGKLIPTVEDLWNKWTEIWADIELATSNAWYFIETLWAEIGRWINDNLMPWIDLLMNKWKDDWNKMKADFQAAWKIIEPIWAVIKDWLEVRLQNAVEAFRLIWESAMTSIETAIAPVKENWDQLVAAVKGFWNWITGKVFSFKIKIPDLPDWATPGSPLPIHTAWADFAKDMDRMVIQPQMVLPGMAGSNTGGQYTMPGQGSSVIENNTTYSPQYTLVAQSMLRPGGLALEFSAMEAKGAIAA